MFDRKRFLCNENESFVSFSSLPSLAPRRRAFLGALIGGISAASAARQAQKTLDKSHEENSAYYKRLMSENYLDTSAGQETVRQAREVMKQGTNQAAGAAAFGGASDSSVSAAREAANKQVGNMMSGIAANDVQRKDSAGSALASENSNYAQQTANIKMGQANAISKAASGLDALAGKAMDKFLPG